MKQYDMIDQAEYAQAMKELMLINYTVNMRTNLTEEEKEEFLEARLNRMVGDGWIEARQAEDVFAEYMNKSNIGWIYTLSGMIIEAFTRVYEEWMNLRMKVARQYTIYDEAYDEYIAGWVVGSWSGPIEFLFSGYMSHDIVDYSEETDEKPYAITQCSGQYLRGYFLTPKRIFFTIGDDRHEIHRSNFRTYHKEVVLSENQFKEMTQIVEELDGAKLSDEEIKKYQLNVRNEFKEW